MVIDAAQGQWPTGQRRDGEPRLLLAGPVATSPRVCRAALRQTAPQDPFFSGAVERVCSALAGLSGAQASHVCLPFAGSASTAVEAMLGSFLPPDGRLLVLINGSAGWRMARICRAAGHSFEVLEWPEDQAIDPATVNRRLEAEPEISHVAAAPLDSTSGILNPIGEIAEVCQRRGRMLLIDATVSFGCLSLDARRTRFTALAGWSGGALEGLPGIGFCLGDEPALQACRGNASSLTLDLHDLFVASLSDPDWTADLPPQPLLALEQALDELAAEGGVAGRAERYRATCRALVEGLRALGLVMLLPDELQSPSVIAVRMPADPRFLLDEFRDRLRERGFVIEAGRPTIADCFRIGCQGRLDTATVAEAVAAIRDALAALGVADTSPDPRRRSRLAQA